jgi:hypothetical protein
VTGPANQNCGRVLHYAPDDVRTGRNVVATVVVECHSMYRLD